MGTSKAVGPLVALGEALRAVSRPPALSVVIAELGEVEDFAFFQGLVQEYLPEHRESILGAGGIGDMVGAFARAFGERYFPLAHVEDGLIESVGDLTRSIPICAQGLAYDDYHELPDFRPEFVLATLLVDFEGEEIMGGEGIQVTLLEEAARHVPQALLERIPERGFALQLLEERLAGTPYQGLIAHAWYLCHATGSIFLDATCEDLQGYEIRWTREEVDNLTEQWQAARDIQEEADGFLQWLEQDLAGHLAEVLKFLQEEGVDYAKDPRQLELALGPA